MLKSRSLIPHVIAIIVQTPHSVVKSFTCAMRICVETNSATALVILEDENDIDSILQAVKARRHLISLCPLYFLIILCEDISKRNEGWREHLDLSLVQSEKHIGMSDFEASALDGTNQEIQPATPFEKVIYGLHILNTSLIWLSCTTNFELSALKFAQSMILLFEEARIECKKPQLSRMARELLLQQIRYLESAAEMRQHQRNGLQQRAETQIGIVSGLPRGLTWQGLTSVISSCIARFLRETTFST